LIKPKDVIVEVNRHLSAN